MLGLPRVLFPPNVTVWCIPEVKSTVIVEPSDNEDTAAGHLAFAPKFIPAVSAIKLSAVSAVSDLRKEPESIPSTVAAFTLVTEAPLPEKAVAVKVPFEELKVRFVPLLAPRLPVA